MKAFEFQGRLSSDGTLAVPPEGATHLLKAQVVRVIVLVPEPGEDAA